MCLILFVVATVSFPKHKAWYVNFVDFTSIFLVPLLLRYAVKNQKSTRQQHRKPEIQPQKYSMNGEVKNNHRQNHNQEMVTIIDRLTVRYNKRSEARKKNGSESHPNEIIVEGVEKVIAAQ